MSEEEAYKLKNHLYAVASPLVEMTVSSPVLFMLTSPEAPVPYLMQSSLLY